MLLEHALCQQRGDLVGSDGDSEGAGGFFLQVMCLVYHNHIMVWQQVSFHGSIQEQECVVDDDDLGMLCADAHLANVAIGVKVTFAPCTLIAIGTDSGPNIAGERKFESFKIS